MLVTEKEQAATPKDLPIAAGVGAGPRTCCEARGDAIAVRQAAAVSGRARGGRRDGRADTVMSKAEIMWPARAAPTPG